MKHRRHLPFFVAAVAAVLVLPVAIWLLPDLAIAVAANTFFLLYLALTAVKMPRLTAGFLREHAESEDEPAWVIFAVTFGAVVVAVVSLFLAINGAAGADKAIGVALALASVALGWLTIHTMAALHYAHRYWRPEGRHGDARAPHEGLEFPSTDEPAGYDFLYFAFVIGMTAQTSDVQITSTAMRKLNLLHAVVSFFFNTVLVAAAVNLAVSLGNGAG